MAMLENIVAKNREACYSRQDMADRVQHVLDLITSFSESELAVLREKLGPSVISASACGEEKTVDEGVKPICPHCGSSVIKGHGKYRGRSRNKCLSCSRTFNELTGTPMAGSHFPEKINQYVNSMVEGGSLRKIAGKLDIDLKTSFAWRHKILKGYFKEPSRKLTGIAEGDETFFLYSEKGSKSVAKYRKPRKRGGKASTAGVSNEHVPVIFACDRNGEMIIGVAGRGRISVKDIEGVLGGRFGSKVTFCTDSHQSFKAFAKAYRLRYLPINISKGQRVVKKVYHVQNVNGAHMRVKKWMVRFNGVATKYLDNYMKWFSLLEETKLTAEQVKRFAERSLYRLPDRR